MVNNADAVFAAALNRRESISLEPNDQSLCLSV